MSAVRKRVYGSMKRLTRTEHLRLEINFIIQELLEYKSDRSSTLTKPIIIGNGLEFYHEYTLAGALIMYDLVTYEKMSERGAMNDVRARMRATTYRNRMNNKKPQLQRDEPMKYGKLIKGEDIRDVCSAMNVLACYNTLVDYLSANPDMKPTAPIVAAQELYEDEE